MSKTFEALQRAALEKRARQRETPEPDSNIVSAGPEGGAASPDMERAVAPPAPPHAPPPESPPEDVVATTPLSGPQGETDSTLTELLRQHLCREDDSVLVETDGWVRGHLDREAARALLKCYALLHCLRQDHDNWFWFWGSSTTAEERSGRSGFPLDMAGFD